jgi:nucleoid-associated protein YgaU
MRASIARAVVERGPVDGIDALLDAAARLGIRDFTVHKVHGKTMIGGIARYQLDRDELFEAVKLLDGWESEIVLDVAVERQDVRGYHTVREGETLASIAKRHLGRSSRDREVFEANRDRMNDPDQIFPGQQLLIPWR